SISLCESLSGSKGSGSEIVHTFFLHDQRPGVTALAAGVAVPQPLSQVDRAGRVAILVQWTRDHLSLPGQVDRRVVVLHDLRQFGSSGIPFAPLCIRSLEPHVVAAPASEP